MDTVQISHGSGGAMSEFLIDKVFKKYLSDFLLFDGEDGGIFPNNGKMAVSTDSFVVSPIFFHGGDIGKLSVCGSSNDVAMMGAKPRFITLGFILEEGLSFSTLHAILESMSRELKKQNLMILSADTKVVPRGNVDKIFINTTVIGEVVKPLSIKYLSLGDDIILSGPVGAHGGVIFCARNTIDLQTQLESDCQSLYEFLEPLFYSDIELHALRDVTRGGLASVLNEWVRASDCDILVRESNICVPDEVRGVCEILGLDAYSLASEGAFVLALPKKSSKLALSKLHEAGLKQACIIGEIRQKQASNPSVTIANAWGSERFLDYPQGELLPRIC